jgi:hypothetical protein
MQQVLKNSANPNETARPHKLQVEIGDEAISNVRIYWMRGRSFHK